MAAKRLETNERPDTVKYVGDSASGKYPSDDVSDDEDGGDQCASDRRSTAKMHSLNSVSGACSQATVSIGCGQVGKGLQRTDRLKDCIQHSVSDKAKKKITVILNEVEQLNDVEKLLLYLQLPDGCGQEIDPLKQKGHGSTFGKKADMEVSQTYNWIKSHLEEDSTVSLPKHEVYDEYRLFCNENKFEPLCVADFGKAMKSVFPRVKPRRLGQRGNSKYCYSGLRKKMSIEPPELPVLDTSACYQEEGKGDEENGHFHDEADRKGGFSDEALHSAACHLVLEWAKNFLGSQFESITDLSRHLIESKIVDDGSVAALTLVSAAAECQSSAAKNNNSPRIHLQRKLQEKEKIREQKKKLEQNKCFGNNKINQNGNHHHASPKLSKKNKKNSVSKPSPETVCTVNTQAVNDFIKKEPQQVEPESPPIQVQQTQHLQLMPNLAQNKVPIPRTGTPSRLSQSAIILVPTMTTSTVRLTSPQPNGSTIVNIESAPATTNSILQSTSPIKSFNGTTVKYKKIQPKPVAINRSDSESAVAYASNGFDSVYELSNSISRRRHSVSVPLHVDINGKKSFEAPDKQAHIKRHMEEKDTFDMVSNKKRMVVDNNSTKVNPNSANSHNNPMEDINSSNSLSPLSQAELQAITSNVGAFDTSDIGIQEIESDALMDSFIQVSNLPHQSNENWENPITKSDQISQLRKLLEKNLPKVTNNKLSQRCGDGIQPLDGFSELREALLRKNLTKDVQSYGHLKTPNNGMTSLNQYLVEHSNNQVVHKSRELDGLVTSPVLDNLCLPVKTKNMPLPPVDVLNANHFHQQANAAYANVQVQVPSVPPSPNARRRAFNFQPISPRNTPTIPEHTTIDTNGFSFSLNSRCKSNSSPQYRVNQQTVAVGPSQPPSEANSPFVSPRSTPIPLSRSRHNSGQSNYGTLRQTPLQNVDSGVSSISSSPFISPQSTPVPISRFRAATGNGMQKNLNRARHSSGPGGPCSVSHAASFLYHRSNSLSPMISDGFMGHVQSHPFADGSELIEMIPPNTGQATFSNMLLKQHKMSSSELMNHNDNELFQKDWQPINPQLHANNSTGNNRHRHSSHPFITSTSTLTHANSDQFSPEISSFLKNTMESEPMTVTKASLINRCQSVPVHQMIQATFCKTNNDLSPNNTGLCPNIFEDGMSMSKSYPATPICNQNFQFPPSPPASSNKLQNVNVGETISGNVLRSGQDVMVSGLQMNRPAGGWNSTIGNNNDNELIGINTNSTARRNLNDLLTEPQDDLQLQATIEDLNDIICDDFQSLAQELGEDNSVFDGV